MGRFSDKVVIVSGGARGMGESHVRAFAAEGANVVIADVLTTEANALADDLSDRAVAVRLDVTSEGEWAAAVALAQATWGRVDVLVNNAGIAQVGVRMTELSVEDFRQVLDVNLVGSFLGVRAVAPAMSSTGGGAIVNIGSVAGLTGGLPGSAGYSASKWGVRGLTRTAAGELGSDGIRINCVHPGVVLTPMQAQIKGAPLHKMSARFPIARGAQPDEISRMVLFLASDEASFITGNDFTVDGGMTAAIVPDDVPDR